MCVCVCVCMCVCVCVLTKNEENFLRFFFLKVSNIENIFSINLCLGKE